MKVTAMSTSNTLFSAACHRLKAFMLPLGVALLVLSTSPTSHADGLKVRVDLASWPQWQARAGVVTTQHAPLQSSLASATTAPRAAALLGDYYFTGPGFDPKRVGGGLRATTGWLYGGSLALGAPHALSPAAVSTTVMNSSLVPSERPAHAAYIGIGYTGLSLKHGWGVLADVGLVGTTAPGASRLIGDDFSIRNDRLIPTVRLGMSYAF